MSSPNGHDMSWIAQIKFQIIQLNDTHLHKKNGISFLEQTAEPVFNIIPHCVPNLLILFYTLVIACLYVHEPLLPEQHDMTMMCEW